MMRRSDGQATPEYVGVVLVVAILLGGIAAATWTGVGSEVLAKIREALCRVAGGICTPEQARAEGYEPCVVYARRDDERGEVRVWFLRAGTNQALVIEERSDGTARVSFVNAIDVGGVLGAGVGEADASLFVGGGLVRGDSWSFPTTRAARAFVRRWASLESIGGELVRDFPWNERPREPDERFFGGGVLAGAELGLDVPAPRTEAQDPRAELRGAHVIGRRVSGDRTTWYLKLEGAVAARLDHVVALRGQASAEGVLELATERGRAVEITLVGSAQAHGELALRPGTARLPEVRDRVRDATALRGGRRVDASATLDLTDEANRRAASGLLAALAPGTKPEDVAAAARAFGARLDAAAEVHLQVSRFSPLEGRDLSFDAGAARGGGFRYVRSGDRRELLEAWSLRPGGTLREREDCAEAARARA